MNDFRYTQEVLPRMSSLLLSAFHHDSGSNHRVGSHSTVSAVLLLGSRGSCRLLPWWIRRIVVCWRRMGVSSMVADSSDSCARRAHIAHVAAIGIGVGSSFIVLVSFTWGIFIFGYVRRSTYFRE